MSLRDYRSIENTTYELIVIGGGINGAGAARDGAMRGLKTILLEKGDFASKTSSWSTRLIHGGLRYLEYFEFALVRDSLREREILLNTASHLVKPLLLTIPIYADRSRPDWKIRAGMTLYDILSYDKTLPSHRMLSKATFRQLFPDIDSEGLQGAAQYYDATVAHAERLCLENVIAAEAAGATVLNYTEVTRMHRQENSIASLSCKDVLTGKEFTLGAGEGCVIANTSGPWVDRVCQLGEKDGTSAPIGTTPKIGGTKGSHIIVEPFPGAPESSLYVEAKSDGRPFFIIPWLGMYLIGTTDIPFHGDLDRVAADEGEIEYLLAETNNLIPIAALSRQEIKYVYSGVRPLPNQEGKKPGSITRKHVLFDHSREGANNFISLIGGKLSTYRQVGEEIVDAAFKKLQKPAPLCLTASVPLPGCTRGKEGEIKEAIKHYQSSISSKTIRYLLSVYGIKALEVLALTVKEPELAEPITPELPDIKAQIVYAVRFEYARTLKDITLRRTFLAIRAESELDSLSKLVGI